MLFVPAWHIVLPKARWDTLFSRRLQAVAKILVSLSMFDVSGGGNLSTDASVRSKSASNQPYESSNASPDRYEQEPWASVALWWKADVVTSGTFPEHVCPAVGWLGQNSQKLGLGWYRRSIGERRNWLFPLGYNTVQGCWVLPRTPGSHRQEMFCCNPSWHVGTWSHQHANWCVETSGWPFVWIENRMGKQNEHCQSGKFVRKWCLLNPPAIEDHTDERYCG